MVAALVAACVALGAVAAVIAAEPRLPHAPPAVRLVAGHGALRPGLGLDAPYPAGVR